MRISGVLILVLVIVAGIFMAVRFGFERGESDEALYPDFRPDLARAIEIEGRQKTAVLEKVGDTWAVTSEDSFPAEDKAVQAILEEVGTFSHKDIVSSNPAKQALYEVDSAGVVVSIRDAAGKDMVSFVVGKVGPDYQSTYVRDAASDKVILATGYLAPTFDRGTRTWQDKSIFALQAADIAQIEIALPGETLALARDANGEWYVSRPESLACDQNKVGRMVRTLASLRCDDFAGRAPLPGSGLAEADSSLSLKTLDGKEERLAFGHETENKQVYVAKAGSDIVYLLAVNKLDTILPRLEEVRLKEVGVGEE